MDTITLPSTETLINELQSFGARLVDPKAGHESRRGGAGPSDHKALTIDGMTVMVPVHTAPAFESPYVVEKPDDAGKSRISRDGKVLGEVSFPLRPRFYERATADGIPYSQIAVLHGRDVLATTVLCRPASAIRAHQNLSILRYRPVARRWTHHCPQDAGATGRGGEAAVELDGVKHMVMTTGTPRGDDRGAAVLAESARAIKAAVDLPIQGQCEPPEDDIWFERMKQAGIDTLGMHLEAVTPEVRARIMPGKAQVRLKNTCVPSKRRSRSSDVDRSPPISLQVLATRRRPFWRCASAWWPSASTLCRSLRPISGTPLESHPTPPPAFMHAILSPCRACSSRAA